MKIDFRKYSSLKIGQEVEVALFETIEQIDEDYYIIGKANNLLVSPNPPKLALLSKAFDYIKIEGKSIKIGGATPTGKIVSFAKKHNLAHFEFLSKLPGTLGGAMAMNAGVKQYEIFNHLDRLLTSQGEFAKDAIDFGYRFAHIQGVVYEAQFAYEEGFDEALLKELIALRSNQPKSPSCGSCFKNPTGDYAGRLIEAVGMKGYSVGDAGFSNMHANFLVNLGEARFEDAITLINETKERVKSAFGIVLEEEVKII